MKTDNSTLRLKILLRKNCLNCSKNDPVILETHGGYGRIYDQCYEKYSGIVFEKSAKKAEYLAKQRPSWIIYQADSLEWIVRKEIINFNPELRINFIDIDPYGDPWAFVDAVFRSDCIYDDNLIIVVTDGLRMRLKKARAWCTSSMYEAVEAYGESNCYTNYKEICRELFTTKAAIAGYVITNWVSYYCGFLGQMTHYAATLDR